MSSVLNIKCQEQNRFVNNSVCVSKVRDKINL